MTTSWAVSSKSNNAIAELRDFRKLNKLATGHGNHTAQQYSNFRKTNDVRVKLASHYIKPIVLPPQEFRYGKRNRPQTPVGGIVSNVYGSTAAEAQQIKYARWREYVSNDR